MQDDFNFVLSPNLKIEVRQEVFVCEDNDMKKKSQKVNWLIKGYLLWPV